MNRLFLSIGVLIIVMSSSQASAQRGGDFLLAEPHTGNVALASDEAIPPLPQASNIQEKNPWIAFGLSALITGGGQYYNGHYGKGTVQFVAAAAGLGVFLAAEEDDYKLFGERFDPDDDNNRGAIGALVFLGSAIWSMVDAPISANNINHQLQQASLQIHPVVMDDLTGVSLTLRF